MGIGFRLYIIAIVGFALVQLSACSDEQWTKLSADEIRDILPELSLLEATANFRDMPDSARQALYTSYFEARGITQADWDSTMAWYAKHQMVMYENFYRVASEQMEKQRLALQTKKDSVFVLEQRENLRRNAQLDSVNLLQDTMLVYRSGELLNRHWKLSPSAPYPSGTRLLFSLQMRGLRSEVISNLKLTAELRMHASDSTVLLAQQTQWSNGLAELSLTVPEGKTVNLVTAYLRGVLPNIATAQSSLMLYGVSIKKYPTDVTIEDTHDALVTEEVIELPEEL